MIRRLVLLAVSMCIAACEREKTPAVGTSSSSSERAVGPSAKPPAGVPNAATTMPWADELGGILATPSLDGGVPIVFVRDTGGGADQEVELFSHDDRTSRAVLHSGAAAQSCAWRREASFTPGEGGAMSNNWLLALAPGVAVPYGIDGAEELLPRDSAALVARVSRLVSAIPEDSTSSPFRGLPIVVRGVWRFRLADSTIVVVAIAMRSLNVESNPRTQAIMLIAEPDGSSGDGRWRTVFSERVVGPEDRVEGMDLLAAFQLRGGRAAVALAREGDAGLQLEIVERTAPGVWALSWSSSALPCARA
jgi:hypothetical protein